MTTGSDLEIQGQYSAGDHETEVHVKSLITGESVAFRMPATATVQATWDEAYQKLGESHRDGESFRCTNGVDLMDRLSDTLAQLRQQHIYEDAHFEIRGPSGGA